ncbi:hypothetical protein KFK09_014750 [Dendrobium nobile]|uniref:MULE transposase domain-containing protein n=1 Tax=Dendrobium nobile TaxID=94219 RepID=A0A8T3B2P6_DENNO|nr:hypothetical protein KFK09_014750 [Dendrobium nobile]
MSRLLLYLDGELRISDEFTPAYIGGRNRSLLIDGIITLEMLKLRIMRALRINPTTNTITLTCRIRDNGGFSATNVFDDEICEYMLMEARTHTVVVYVEVEQISGSQADVPSAQAYVPTTTSEAFMPIVRDISSNVEDHLHGHNWFCERRNHSTQQLPRDEPRRSAVEHPSWETTNYEQAQNILPSVASMPRNSQHEPYTGEHADGDRDEVEGQQLDMKLKKIVARMESKFDIKISYMKAWDARRKAIEATFGSYEQSYRSLFCFMEALRLSQSGSVYSIHVVHPTRFKGLSWAFGASICGWEHCRQVLSMDGTFLLGKYRGTLLAAVGIDGNGGLFPLAFTVVESESNESWIWFLQKLQELVPSVVARDKLCIISDKHPGLVRGCREVFPNAVHRHCLRHLRENFKKMVRRLGTPDSEGLSNKMYFAGNTDDYSYFNRMMDEIKMIKQEAFDWLVQRDVSKWSLFFDEGHRYGIMTTNASECFNGVLKRARGFPIQGLIMSFYYNLVTLFLKRSAESQKWVETGHITVERDKKRGDGSGEKEGERE